MLSPHSAHRESFGARVRSFRTERGWSQEDFAHLADLDRTYVSGVERGRRNPTLDVIVRLAAALDVAPSALLESIAVTYEPQEPPAHRRAHPARRR